MNVDSPITDALIEFKKTVRDGWSGAIESEINRAFRHGYAAGRETMRQELAEGVCQHNETSPGPNVRLRYGGSGTEVCDSCGWYRLTFNPSCCWQPGPVDTGDDDDDN